MVDRNGDGSPGSGASGTKASFRLGAEFSALDWVAHPAALDANNFTALARSDNARVFLVVGDWGTVVSLRSLARLY